MQSISGSTRKNHHRPHVRALNFGTVCFVNLEKGLLVSSCGIKSLVLHASTVEGIHFGYSHNLEKFRLLLHSPVQMVSTRFMTASRITVETPYKHPI